MAYYRLYFLNGGGHIEEFREFEAVTDAAAITQADEWRSAGAMELWSGRRKVRSWQALGLSPEAIARSRVRAVRAFI
jgi:hypothetical protein